MRHQVPGVVGQWTRVAPWVCTYAHPGGPILLASATSSPVVLKRKEKLRQRIILDLEINIPSFFIKYMNKIYFQSK